MSTKQSMRTRYRINYASFTFLHKDVREEEDRGQPIIT